MPIFEFFCSQCNRIYSFLSLSLTPKRQPQCPRCGNSDLTRVPSSFAVSSKRAHETPTTRRSFGGEGNAGKELEREMGNLLSHLDEKDMEDPRTMARVMRRLAQASGEPVPETLEEMMQRMEAGEDPEKLEEELGDRLEEEIGPEGEEESVGGITPERDPGLYNL